MAIVQQRRSGASKNSKRASSSGSESASGSAYSLSLREPKREGDELGVTVHSDQKTQIHTQSRNRKQSSNNSNSYNNHQTEVKTILRRDTDFDAEADRQRKLNEARDILAQRWRNWHVRAVWSVVMIAAFCVILLMGHFWVVVLVTVIHTLVFREVIAIAYVPSKQRIPWFRTMTWYFLLSTNYFLYGQTVIQYFKENGFVDSPLATHHTFVSFLLYIIGFVLFVSNLQKDYYKFQISQFAWTHMALLLVVVQSQFIVKNIFEGLVWFLLPVSLVICNDITAYVSGFFFGKTPLIQLSPKKTWEGFIGAFIATIIFAFFFAGWIIRYEYVICPVVDLRASYFWPRTTGNSSCIINPVFDFVDYNIFGLIIKLSVFQAHAVIMALFASIFAPFGGFFASGVKRAFQIKDFSDSIPGHGGLTDRMDCQFLMSFFAFLYYQSFIALPVGLTISEAMDIIVKGLNSTDKQLELYRALGDRLVGLGAI